MTVKDLIRKRNEYVMACGGWFGLREADNAYNDLNHNIIQAFKDENEHCYMGNINLYGQKREDMISGKILAMMNTSGRRFIILDATLLYQKQMKNWRSL